MRQAVSHLQPAPGRHRPVLAGHQGRQPALPVGPDPARSGDRATSSTGDIEAQTRQVFQNIGAILERRRRVVRPRRHAPTVYLADMNDFAQGERDLRDLLLARPLPRAPPCRSRACPRDAASRSRSSRRLRSRGSHRHNAADLADIGRSDPARWLSSQRPVTGSPVRRPRLQRRCAAT